MLLLLAVACGPSATMPTLHPDVDHLDRAVVTLSPAAGADAAADGDGSALRFDVRVAETPAAHRRGLMGVEHLPDGTGMLFVFDGERTGGFWMRDTLVPLDIAFADASGTVLDVRTMAPCTRDPCTVHDPGVAYAVALEVPAGALAGAGVGPGATLEWERVGPEAVR